MPFTESVLQQHSQAVDPGTPVPTVVSTSVSMRQMRLALIEKRKVTAVNDAIKAIADTTERAKIQVEWDYSTSIERDSAWFKSLMDGIGYSEAEVTDLFDTAAGL